HFTKNADTRFSAPWKIALRDTRNSGCASGWQQLRVSPRTRSPSRGFEAPIRRGADDAGEFRLAPEQVAKIDDVEAEKCGWPRRDDRSVTRIAGQQSELAKEIP